MQTTIYLGVDGGGTKTAFTLIDQNATVISTYEHTTSYHLQIGLDGLRTLCMDGVRILLAQAQLSTSDISYAFFGLPAYGEDSRITWQLDAIPEQALGHKRYACGNDMISGWAGSLGGKDGINIIAGTGSIGYGERKTQSARAGGWGELFSDEGSAYWIATKGLNAFSRMSDGRLAKSQLHTIFMKTFDLKSDLDLSGIVMSEYAADRDKVADLSKLVTAAAEAGDSAALHIFNLAAEELVGIVNAIAKSLNFAEDEHIPVSYSGGVFNAGELILTPFRRHLATSLYLYDIVAPLHSPQIGAALYAMRCASR